MGDAHKGPDLGPIEVNGQTPTGIQPNGSTRSLAFPLRSMHGRSHSSPPPQLLCVHLTLHRQGMGSQSPLWRYGPRTGEVQDGYGQGTSCHLKPRFQEPLLAGEAL